MNRAFITGMGRSGSKFVASLLATDRNVLSTHEHFGGREYWLASWYLGPQYSVPALEQALRMAPTGDYKVHVDTNSYLNTSVSSLKEVFPDAPIFHLVRSPLEVVPSLMVRRSDTRMHQIPKNRVEIERWLVSSKFEQVCLNWVQNTENMLSQTTNILHFEELHTNYDYLNRHLLLPLGISVSRETFHELKINRVNSTKGKMYRYLYSRFKGKPFVNEERLKLLSKDKERLLMEICGPTMKKIGYSTA